jgi:hypothetical protein
MTVARETVLGTTTVTNGWKVSLNKDVRKVLERDGEPVKVGDRLMYVLSAEGEIVIRKPYVKTGEGGPGRRAAAAPSIAAEAKKWISRDRDRASR